MPGRSLAGHRGAEHRPDRESIRKLAPSPTSRSCRRHLVDAGARENAGVLIEERVPVVNVSLGKCDWIAERVHAYGGKVIATVTTEKHARAPRSGGDALQVTGNEAAAHGSQIGSLVLIPAIVRAVKLPVVAVGGFGTATAWPRPSPWGPTPSPWAPASP